MSFGIATDWSGFGYNIAIFVAMVGGNFKLLAFFFLGEYMATYVLKWVYYKMTHIDNDNEYALLNCVTV